MAGSSYSFFMRPYDLSETSRMPDSPDSLKTAPTTGGISVCTNHKMAPLTGVNGAHSPHGSSAGTPSPPSSSLPPSSAPSLLAEVPLTCNVRQLSKLKRFLTTLQQFAADVSPEVGERVHSYILGLVSSNLSIEEFHQKIQEVTNYPLRSFVIPFLKSHLPLLQQEVLHFARMAKQTPQQYVRQHEQLLLDMASHNGGEPFEIFQSEGKEGATGKRRISPDVRPKENGFSDSSSDGPPPPKRHAPVPSPTLSSRITSAGTSNHIPASLNFRFDESSLYRDRYERFERDICRPYYGSLHRDYPEDRDVEDEWKNIHTMLSCILGMVEKTKRALAILQHRSQAEKQEYSSLWNRRHLDGGDFDLKKRDLIAHYKTAEDRVSDVRRRAEEAVNEVKRQAVAELQKAVSAAETKASEMVTAERTKMERLISEAKRQATEEALAAVNNQEESTENCWNCGRKANETCSGCNVARYCGAYCQHKDWEHHHRACGQGATSTSNPSSTTSATTSSSTTVTPSNRSPSPSRTCNDSKH